MSDNRKPVEAGVSWFSNDEAGYSRWLDEHPAGYVLNCEHVPSHRYLVLHRASCATISGRPTRGTTWTVAYAKACAESALHLEHWVEGLTGAQLSRCGRCHP